MRSSEKPYIFVALVLISRKMVSASPDFFFKELFLLYLLVWLQQELKLKPLKVSVAIMARKRKTYTKTI